MRETLDRAIPGRPDAVNRAAHDFYRTPRHAIDALLDVEVFSGEVWEPACGDGAISDALVARGISVTSSDLIDYGYPSAVAHDFLNRSYVPDQKFGCVVTNPPFKLAQAFCERALEVSDGKVAMLCRLLFLAGKKRSKFFASTPLARVWVFPSRINFNRDNEERYADGTGGMIDYAWLVWEHGYVGAPSLRWLATK